MKTEEIIMMVFLGFIIIIVPIMIWLVTKEEDGRK
jgi:hypothetical protein